MTAQGPWPSLDKASAFYRLEKEKAEDPGFNSPRVRHVFRVSTDRISRVKSKCSVVHGLSFFVVIDGFSTISKLEGFSKHSRVYGNYKLSKLKIDRYPFTI